MPICQRCGANLTSYFERKCGLCVLCEHSPSAESPLVTRMELAAIPKVVKQVPAEVAAIAKACLLLGLLGILVALAFFIISFPVGVTQSTFALINLLLGVPLNVLVINQSAGLLQLQHSTRIALPRRAWVLYLIGLVLYAALIIVSFFLPEKAYALAYPRFADHILKPIMIAGLSFFALFGALAIRRAREILTRADIINAFDGITEAPGSEEMTDSPEEALRNDEIMGTPEETPTAEAAAVAEETPHAAAEVSIETLADRDGVKLFVNDIG